MTTLPEWREEPIARHRNRASFDCGDEILNQFLQQYARQNHETGLSKTFLAISNENEAILGYYTLSLSSVSYFRVPEVLRRNLGRYDLPTYRLGRLAVDNSFQGRKLGYALVMAAGRRCLRVATEVGGIALLVDAKDDQVAGWYRRFGATSLLDAPRSLLIPLRTLVEPLAQ